MNVSPSAKRAARPRRGSMNMLFAVVAAIGFAVAAASNGALLRLRAAYRLDAAEPLENAPPLVAFTTVVLGGFRGLLADVLWLRAARMQEQGNYFALVQLAEWITRLEPRATEAWAFHAWNLAYNVSIMMSDDDERWRWVRNGLGLLRGDGLRYNPADPRLYFEIGWLFQHKIGGTTDRAHPYYRRQWAQEMTALLGGERPDFAALAHDPERVSRMREDYQLLPDLMRAVDAELGPFDWRAPETHAIYWAFRGRGHAHGKPFLPCDRMIYQCMAASFLRGTLARDPDTGVWVSAPRPDLLRNTVAVYEAALGNYSLESIKTSYFNFLRHAVLTLVKLGRTQEARWTFDRLRQTFPCEENAGGYDAFVARYGGVLN